MNFEQYTAQISSLAEKHKLDFVVLFGSQARGNTHPKSDIDIAVISRVPIDRTKISMDFDEIFKRDDVEVVNLATASSTLAYAVIRDGKLLYEGEPRSFLRWKVYAIKIWMDTAWLRNLMNKKLLKHAIS